MSIQKRKSERYIPALSYRWLTFMYDTVFRWFGREFAVKCRLVEQAQVKPGHRVLDLGCGTATLTILIKKAQREAEVVGLDGDTKVLKVSRSKINRAGVDIALVRAMAYELPFTDESFDRVFASLVFHHLNEENKARAFTEVFRVLKRGGELHVAEFGKPHNKLMYLISQYMRRIEETEKIIKGLLPEMLGEAGFEGAEETTRYGTFFGTINLYRARKPE